MTYSPKVNPAREKMLLTQDETAAEFGITAVTTCRRGTKKRI